MPDQSKKTFPSIPVSHWFALRSQFKKSIPGTVTTNYLASVLTMTELSARNNILPALRQIGLIDADSKTNQEMAKKFRDDETYPALCHSLVKSIYPQELQDAFPDKESNKDKVKSWFMNHSGQGESGGGKMAGFYLTLLDANPSSIGGATAKAAIPKKEAKPKPATSQKQKPTTNSLGVPEQPAPNMTRTNAGPELNINIQIHISSDASPDQIKSIFENMAKYIYKS
jgi:Family of unknown function (DUF5343)